MFRALNSARRKSSHFAMAIALATGGAIATAAMAPVAYAQDEPEPVTDEFYEVYQPVAAMTQGDAPDYEAVRGQLAAVQAAVQSPADQFAAGNLTLVTGNQLSDPELQRRGLEMMVDSGNSDAERTPRFNLVIASLAINAGDYQAARERAAAALAGGYDDGDDQVNNDPEYLIMSTYFDEEDIAGGVNYVLGLNEQGAVPEMMLRNALQNAYDYDLAEQANTLNYLILEQNPTQSNWTNALRIYYQINDIDEPMNIDTLRLLRLVGGELERSEYSTLVEELDARIMGNEVLQVLDAGLAAGVYTSDDPFFTENRATATSRASADRSEMASIIADGNSGDVRDAIASANVLYSLENYAEAARLFEAAANGSADPNLALTRLGMSQVAMGDYAAAQETFARVTGQRAALARYWSIYAASMAAQ